jgi:ABC-type phosphate transport system substrate-binding protein
VNKKKAIADFLKWMITDGQRFAEPLSYVPLPKVIADRELVAISQLE